MDISVSHTSAEATGQAVCEDVLREQQIGWLWNAIDFDESTMEGDQIHHGDLCC